MVVTLGTMYFILTTLSTILFAGGFLHIFVRGSESKMEELGILFLWALTIFWPYLQVIFDHIHWA